MIVQLRQMEDIQQFLMMETHLPFVQILQQANDTQDSVKNLVICFDLELYSANHSRLNKKNHFAETLKSSS